MNILFHTTAAIGLIATLNETSSGEYSNKKKMVLGLICFAIGIVSHGALDYIPHCYPINPKVDVIIGAIIIGTVTLLSKPKYRLIVGLTFLGNIFPDIIDLSPQILNKYLELSIPLNDKIFPWHWEKYSGSIFIDDCKTSTLNHLILITVTVSICIMKKNNLKNIFKSKMVA